MRLALAVPILIFALFSSPGLLAQFTPPPREELNMTSEPKASGAAAVYLYREEETGDTLHFHSYYERIKVLTEKGRDLANIRIPFEHGSFTVTDIQGRTIHPVAQSFP